jgi:hypothetical protein
MQQLSTATKRAVFTSPPFSPTHRPTAADQRQDMPRIRVPVPAGAFGRWGQSGGGGWAQRALAAPRGNYAGFGGFGGLGTLLPTGMPALPQKPPACASLGAGRYLAPGGANPRLRAFMGSEGMLPGSHTSRLLPKLDLILTLQPGQGVGNLLRLGQVSFDVAETAAITVPQGRGKADDACRFRICAHASPAEQLVEAVGW